MKARLSVLLLVPTIALLVAASLLVRDRDRALNSAREANAVAVLAGRLADLDSALGDEAVDSAAALSGFSTLPGEVRFTELVSARQRTDTVLGQLRHDLASVEIEFDPAVDAALATTEQTLAFRSDVDLGLISPLQIADRYAHIRNALVDALATQVSAGDLTAGNDGLVALTSLIRARSDHVDERLSLSLVLTYETWAPGQHGAVTAKLGSQSVLLDTARSFGSVGDPRDEIPDSLVAVRSVVAGSNDVPDVRADEWAGISASWLVVLDEHVARQSSDVIAALARAERAAASARNFIVLGVVAAVSTALALTGVVSLRLIRRIGILRENSDAITAGNAHSESLRIDTQRDEIGQLSRSFATMAERLSNSARLRDVETAVFASIARGEPIADIMATASVLLNDDLDPTHADKSGQAVRYAMSPLEDVIAVDAQGTQVAMPSTTAAQVGVGLVALAYRRSDDLDRLERQATFDPLTEMYTRRAIMGQLRMVVERTRTATVWSIDLDGFKPINDRYGHAAGDVVLLAQASRLMEFAMSVGGFAGRLGGDEFLVVTGRVFDDPEAMSMTLLESLQRAIDIGVTRVSTNASIGVAVRLEDDRTVESLLTESDAALINAKRNGKGQIKLVTDEFRADQKLHTELRSDLVDALDRRDSFVPYFQPIWSDNGTVLSGFEALARWQRNGEIISPGVFVPIAEEAREMDRLDKQFFAVVCEQLAQWRHNGREFPPVSVNVSAARLEAEGFVEETLDAIEHHGLDPQSLVLEVTEDGVMSNVADNAARLERLRAAGLRIATDDFGKGYSSLAYLRRLPLDIVKIDRQFVDGIDSTQSNRAIVSAVREMARELGIEVIAEGVERIEEFDTLVELGCERMQGFLLGRPAPTNETTALIGRQRGPAFGATGTERDPAGPPVRRPEVSVTDDS